MKLQEGMYVGIANEQYHANRTAISSTWLKIIDRHSPWHLRSYLDSPPAEPTPALAIGSAVDCLIFEPEKFNEQFIVAPELNLRTKAGREEMAALKATAAKTYQTVLKLNQHTEALETAASVRTNPRMADILKRGVPQPVFIWKDPVTGLLCKCKVDWYDEKDGTVYDLKTAREGSPSAFAKAVANYGYHIQQAFYSDGIRALGKPVRRFVFCVQEKPDDRYTFKADPRLMSFYELSQEDDDAGRDAYASALSAIDFCITNDEWAGYTDDIITITRPGWAKKSDMEQVTGL
jgi:hypothetical protein